MPDLSPDQWFAFLSDKLASRLPELMRIRRYVTGDAPLPQGATQFRESYARWQKMSRTNFAEPVIDAKADRLKISGFRVGQDPSDNDAARAIWRRSQGGGMAADVHRDALTYGVGYALASEGRRGAVLTRESPFTTVVETDPLDPTWVQAGLKVWSERKVDHAVLHLPGQVVRFVRPTPSRTRLPDRPQLVGVGGWQVDELGSGATGLDRVPIVEFVNKDGVGEFANHTDLLDRLNRVILDRLLIIAMQAFRQRALQDDSKDGEGLPETDEDGNEIDWNEEFIAGPDALWILPPGVKIWESQPGDIQQILTAAKDDLGQLSSVTQTPMARMMPGDGENQTAEGAAFAREGLVFACEDRVERFTAKWDDLVGSALELDGVTGAVETQWMPCDRPSMAERFDALSKAGALPWRDQMTDILGYSSDRVDRMAAERSAEQATAVPVAVVPPTPAA